MTRCQVSPMAFRTLAPASLVALFLIGCEQPTPMPDSGPPACVPGTATIDELYTTQLGPKCVSCHGLGSGQGGLFFNDARSFHAAMVNVNSTSTPSVKRVVPSRPETSQLVFRISADTLTAQRMPLGAAPLDQHTVDAIAGWICAGAPPPRATDAGVDAGSPDAGQDAGPPDAGPQDAGLSLASFAPQAGVVGTRVTLTGTGFSTTASEDLVRFSGATALVHGATGTQLEVEVPVDAGTGLISVTVFGNTVMSAMPFTVVPGTPAPVLTSVTPSTALVGAATLNVVLAGQNFRMSSVARLDGVALPTTFQNAGLLLAQLDSAVFAQAGAHELTVSTPAPDGGAGGGTSAPRPFTVENPLPALTSISPASVAVGGAAFSLTVTGTGFVASSEVELDGVPVATSFVSATSLTAAMPSFATATTHNLTVRNPAPGGGASTQRTLTVIALPQPSISTLAPNPGPANQAFALNITGANFTCTGGGPVVLFDGGVFAHTGCSSTTLSTQLPATPPGTSDVVVRNPNNDVSAPVSLTLVAPNPVPTLSAISPTQVNTNSGAQTLTVTGADFISSSLVHVNGASRATTFVSSTSLTAALLASDVVNAGTRTVTVFTPAPGGGTSSPLTLTVVLVNPVPSVTSISPSTLVTGSGATQLRIFGSNFVATSQATFEGSPRTTAFIAPTELTIDLSAADVATPGTFSIGVTNPTPGGGNSNGLSLTVGNAAPAVTSLSPCGVVAGAGFTLTINGTGFLATSTVSIEGTAVTPTFVSSTRLTAAVPGSLVGTAPTNRALTVVVTTPAPGGGQSSAILGVASQPRTLSADVQPILTAACAGCHSDFTSGSSATSLIGVPSGCGSVRRVLACGPLPSHRAGAVSEGDA